MFRLPSTGSAVVDLFIAAGALIVGLWLAVKRESKWGWLIVVAALYYAFQTAAPFYR